MAQDIKPRLLKKIRKYGAFDINACFNCGNCTAVCPLAQESGGFPRRVIRMGQVGMEKQLLAEEDLWRCFACGECTRTCPRQADPAQYMAAARRYAVSRYDITGISRFMNASWIGNMIAFIIFSIFFTLLLLSHKGLMNGHDYESYLFKYIPGWWIHDIGVALFVVIGLSAVTGATSMVVRVIKKKRLRGQLARFSISSLIGAIAAAIHDSVAHKTFQRCDEDKKDQPLPMRPWFVHAMIMGGFLTMLAATMLDYLFKPIGSYVPPWYPMRVLGMVGGLACLYGLTLAIARRLKKNVIPYNVSRFDDWFFLLLLALTVLTGFCAEISAYMAPSTVGAILFLTHVVLAMDLIVMMPLNKFAHVIYRPLALTLYGWALNPESATATLGAAAPSDNT